MEWPENKYRQTKFGNDLIVPSSSETSINVPELIDAENAGRNDARNCTLVLTEGECKKKFTWGHGKQNWGVYPIRGKMLNVKDASESQIKKSKQLNKN